MKVTMMLCDHAEALNGKLYIMGGGWTICPPGPSNMSVAIKILVPWDQANDKHKFSLTLRDEDSNIVTVGPDNRQVKEEGYFEVGRPPGVKKGSALDFVLAIIIGGLPLVPDKGYRWQLEINDEAIDDVSFRTQG